MHGVLDLRFISVAADGEVLFHRVNREPRQEGQQPPGLKLRLRGTLLDRFRFEDVQWHQQDGRLVLQDELDLEDQKQGATHELVADAYRRLVLNFERARQYEWAEDAVVGEMEMRRQNPDRFLFARWKRAADFYEEHRWARWFGEHVSFLYLYRLLSFYGSSYRRALSWLAALVFLFAVAFPMAGLRPRDPFPAGTDSEHVTWWRPWGGHTGAWRYLHTLAAGCVTTLETVTLQRDPGYRPANNWARLIAVAELIVIPGQLTLFLLALRRRFRR